MSNFTNFEPTEISYIFKCLRGLDELKVRTVQGGGGPKID